MVSSVEEDRGRAAPKSINDLVHNAKLFSAGVVEQPETPPSVVRLIVQGTSYDEKSNAPGPVGATWGLKPSLENSRGTLDYVIRAGTSGLLGTGCRGRYVSGLTGKSFEGGIVLVRSIYWLLLEDVGTWV